MVSITSTKELCFCPCPFVCFSWRITQKLDRFPKTLMERWNKGWNPLHFGFDLNKGADPGFFLITFFKIARNGILMFSPVSQGIIHDSGIFRGLILEYVEFDAALLSQSIVCGCTGVIYVYMQSRKQYVCVCVCVCVAHVSSHRRL